MIQPSARRPSPALPDDPTIEEITHANIESILRDEERRRRRHPLAYRLVERIARFCGTMAFLWINVAWFVGWVAFNEFWPFDPYPFTLLLLFVSLEAIILSILILISQNMSAADSERRHHLDLQINLLNEREMTAMLRLAIVMADRLGVDEEAKKEAAALARETDPAAVLHQIARAERQRRAQSAQ